MSYCRRRWARQAEESARQDQCGPMSWPQQPEPSNEDLHSRVKMAADGLNWRPMGRAKRLNFTMTQLIFSVIILVNIFCDITPKVEANLHQFDGGSHQIEGNQKQVDQLTAGETVDLAQQPADSPRILQEPRSQLALLGDSLDLGCSLAGLTDGQHPHWLLLESGSKAGKILAMDSRVYRNHLSLPYWRPLASNSTDGPMAPEGPLNYTLRIGQVSILFDNLFTCQILDPSRDWKLESRLARLTVLLPPTRVTVEHRAMAPQEVNAGALAELQLRLESELESESESASESEAASNSVSVPAPESGPYSEPETTTQAGQLAAGALASGDLVMDQASEGEPKERQRHQWASGSQTSGAQLPAANIRRIVVALGSRLSLECHSDRAKPHAKLVWLDEQNREMGRLKFVNDSLANQTIEERISSDNEEPKYQITSLTWTFIVNQEHHGKTFTCLASHQAFEEPERLPRYNGKVLSSAVKLEVVSKPEVSLSVVGQQTAREHEPLAFECSASARPSQLNYSWHIDGQLVKGAEQSRLMVDQVTRQLHMRVVRCTASNSLGSRSAELTLAVEYAPSFVSHLVVQPKARPAPQQVDEEMDGATIYRRLRDVQDDSLEPVPGSQARDLARQLAIGFRDGAKLDGLLSCDFDSNPHGNQMIWFKVQTNYSLMSEVSSQQADELIEFGLSKSHLIGQPAPARRLPVGAEGEPVLELEGELGARQGSLRVDYARQSIELAGQVAHYEQLMKQVSEAALGFEVDERGTRVTPLLSAAKPSHNYHSIYEPLAWQCQGSGCATIRLVEPERVIEPAGDKLATRTGSLTSSSVRFNEPAEFEHEGRYLCKTEVSQASGRQLVAVRAINLVRISQPRIVSQRVQLANPGAPFIKVECLAQISGQLDNRTVISWSRGGKSFNQLQQEAMNEESHKSFTLKVEFSPDLLFMRSSLIIGGHDSSDFANYSCSIENNEGSDKTIIELSSSTRQGRPMTTIMVLTIVSILLLALGVSCLQSCLPSAHLDAKKSNLVAATNLRADEEDPKKQLAANQPPSRSTTSHRSSPSSSTDLSAATMGLANKPRAPTPTEGRSRTVERPQDFSGFYDQLDGQMSLGAKTSANQQLAALSQATVMGSMMLRSQMEATACNDRHSDSGETIARQQSDPKRRPIDMHSRSSLRRPFAGEIQLVHTPRSNGTNPQIAALRENLEKKLVLSPPVAAPSDETDRMLTVSELDGGSIMNKLWSRIAPGGSGFVNGSGRVKTRPVISSPIECAPTMEKTRHSTADPKSTSNKLRGITGKHMISSNTNLIQDSTTTSEVTGSSGRSSSSSSAIHNHLLASTRQQNQINELALARDQNELEKQQQQSGQLAGYGYIQQPPTIWMSAPMQSIVPSQDCNIYVDNHHLYTNTLSQHGNVSTTGHFANSNLSWPVDQLDITTDPTITGHYQHPVGVVNDTYGYGSGPMNIRTPTTGMFQPPACYSAIGDFNNKSHH